MAPSGAGAYFTARDSGDWATQTASG